MTSRRRKEQETALHKESYTNVQIKDEPEDPGYDEKSVTINDYNSSTDSLDSSPLPPVQFENPSPHNISSPVPTTTSQIPLNDLFAAGSSIRSKLRGAINSKKMDSVQNIIEGLLKKNETLLAMSDAGLHKPRRHKKTAQSHSSSLPVTAQSCVFPVSSSLQAHVVSGKQKIPENSKARMKRPKSPTFRHASVLKDKTNFTYSLMESSVGDEEIENIFNVQKHELVCGMGSKSYIEDKYHKLVARLDIGNYWCNFCPYTTTSKSLLVHHTLEHRFSCKFCEYESFCRSDVVRHMHKQHPEFRETADRFYYCTFLSDYLRVKSCLIEKENTNSSEDRDDDVEDSDGISLQGRRKRKLHSKKSPFKKSVKLDYEEASGFEKNDSEHNSLSPDHLGIKMTSKDSDYDMFEMEVEEIGEPSQDTVCEETVHERPVYLVDHESPNLNSHKQEKPPFPTSLLQVISPGQQSNSNLSPVIQHEKLHETGSNTRCNEHSRSSSLFWSCGHCSFQSSSQLDIKAHSSREHVGKPYRYVALVRNMNSESTIPAVKTVDHKLKGTKTAKSSSATNQKSASPPYQSLAAEEDVVSLKDSSKTLKVKLIPMRTGNRVYTCYHCSYTAKRPSSMKSHIYYQHRGKGLVAVDAESASRQKVFFCARDDCTFKSEKPDAFLQHVDQCTPWNSPELSDVEVEPHIRQCLDQTVGFAKMATDKVIENEMERPLSNQKSEGTEGLYLRKDIGENSDVESVHEDFGELVNRVQLPTNDTSEVGSDCESMTSRSSSAALIAGHHCLEVDTNVLSVSASSSESFLPVAVMVKCHIPSDGLCSPRVQEIEGESIAETTEVACVAETIEAESMTQTIVEESVTQTSFKDQLANLSENSTNIQHSELSQSPTNIQHSELSQSPTININIQHSELLQRPTKNFHHSELSQNPTTNIQHSELSQSPTTNIQHSELSQRPTKNIHHSELSQSPTTNTQHSELSQSPTTNIQHSELSQSPTTNIQHSELSQSPTTNIQHSELSQSPATNIQHSELSQSPTTNIQHSELSQSPTTNIQHSGLSQSPTPIDEKPGTGNSSRDSQLSPQDTLSLGISIKEEDVTQQSQSLTLEKNNQWDSLVGASNKDTASTTLKTDQVEVAETKANILKDDSENSESVMNKKRRHSVNSTYEDNNRGIKKENLKSSEVTKPLKLTFKLMGDKTFCRISGQTDKTYKDNKESENMKLSSSAGSNPEAASEAKEGQVPKWLNELIDSSDDSECEGDVLTDAVKEEIEESKSVTGIEAVKISNFTLTCLPARSAAVKALSKMKPALEELDDEDYEWHYRSNKSSKKSKSSHPQSNVTLGTGSKGVASSARENMCLKPSAKNKVTYACNYCPGVVEGPLKKIKSHVLLKHGSQLPLVINCLKRSMQEHCTYFVCSHPACYKLSSTKSGYSKHKASHQNITSLKDPEKSTMRKVYSSHQVAFPKKASSSSETLQSCSVELDVLDISKVSMPSANASQSEKKYQCLYCTHYFYDSSLSGMKSHYTSEHEGQLMVMRDTEARRAQLPSRVYVCEMPNCECCYINRPDLYHHSKSHRSNSTYVYECVSCGWYSSSQEGATQHLKTAHSDEKNVSLIHMQVSIDENGQTSKKVL